MMGLREAIEFLHHLAAKTPLLALEDRGPPSLGTAGGKSCWPSSSQLTARQERLPLKHPCAGAGERWPAGQLLGACLRPHRRPRRVVVEIGADLSLAQPMNRLLQGDVGAARRWWRPCRVCRRRLAGALMAPTEILAEQHFRKLVDWLAPWASRWPG